MLAVSWVMKKGLEKSNNPRDIIGTGQDIFDLNLIRLLLTR